MADTLKQFKKVKKLWGTKDDMFFADEDVLRYRDVLQLMESRGYVRDMQIDNCNFYCKMAEWDGFEDWLKEEIKESKRMSRREWRIAVVSAAIGAAIGLIPYVVSLFAAVG